MRFEIRDSSISSVHRVMDPLNLEILDRLIDRSMTSVFNAYVIGDVCIDTRKMASRAADSPTDQSHEDVSSVLGGH